MKHLPKKHFGWSLACCIRWSSSIGKKDNDGEKYFGTVPLVVDEGYNRGYQVWFSGLVGVRWIFWQGGRVR